MKMNEWIKKTEEWDKNIVVKYNGFGGNLFTKLLRNLSFLGEETIWCYLIGFFLFIWYDPQFLSNIGFAYLFGLVVVVLIKALIKRDRPFKKINNIEVYARKPFSRSFPSWHTYNIVSQGLIISYLSKSIYLVIFFIILIGLVSFSRVQLGVHYPSDVIVGFCLGIIGFILTIFFISPLLIELLFHIENFLNISMVYNALNPLLFENVWYFLLCSIVFGSIFLLALYKHIKNQRKKEKKSKN
ncbi:MAG: phosphatase PAP2 family protein [Candidatus Lokiarchaeota archaeon]|nr:phosphatase PAP2 family protein [Candidatus Lokiarchaeota archaeon]